jgi:DNA (cytosine-5)-methyltransferase 1
MIPQLILPTTAELVVDLFAGGGGASTGIEQAIGRPVDIAVDHDPKAVALHAANHPQTRHLVSDVYEVDPRAVTAERPVGLLWASPDCTFHSKARGGKPFKNRDIARRRRGLAWVICRWASEVHPRVICLENVEEFQHWGPLLDDGTPCPERRGSTFRRWIAQLENLGYRVQWRELRACDYGAPTIRKRLFLVARRDGLPIVWPQPTHGQPSSLPVKVRKLKAWRTAAECIDWSIPCPSILERKKPLAEATLRRVAKGIMRYVVEAAQPFTAPLEHKGGQELDAGACKTLKAAFLAKHYTGVVGSDLRDPIGTVTALDHHSLVSATLITNTGQPSAEPPHIIKAQGQHFAEVRAFLIKYYGSEQDGVPLNEPMHTVPTHDRFGLVTVHGVDYAIADIGLRMLTPRELFRAQGFADSYIIDHGAEGRPLIKATQTRACGNSVCPPMATALVAANYCEYNFERMAA